MPLTIGVNTYATLTDIKTFISTRPYGKILSVSDEDLTAYLVDSFDAFNLLRYKDPPIVNGIVTSWIVEAQCREVIALIFVMSDADFLNRVSLQLQGVSRFQYDRQMEEYKPRKQTAGLYDFNAFRYIRRHLLRFPSHIKVV
jgi:hypothetical protein